MSLSSPVATGVRSEIGLTVPGWLLRAAFAALSLLLLLDRFGFKFEFWIGAGVVAFCVARPRRMAVWVIILLLGASQLSQTPSFDPRFLLLVAGVHALYVLASLMAVASSRARIQVRYLLRVGLRFLCVAVLIQAIAAASLLAFAPMGAAPIAIPQIAVAGAIALLSLSLLIVTRVFARRG